MTQKELVQAIRGKLSCEGYGKIDRLIPPSHRMLFFTLERHSQLPNFAVHQILIPPVAKAHHLAEAPEDCYFEVGPPGSDGPSDLQ